MARTHIRKLATAAAVAIGAGGLAVAAIPRAALAAPVPQPSTASSPFRTVPSPSPGQPSLNATAAISATDVWAVGDTGNPVSGGVVQAAHTLAEHWNGSAWTRVATPDPFSGDRLVAVSAASSTEVWAVGTYPVSSHVSAGFIEHWNGTAWTTVPSAAPGAGTAGKADLASVVAISTNNVYAVGTEPLQYMAGGNTCTQHGYLEHWNGSKWSAVTTPAPCETEAKSVSASSASDVWVVGEQPGNPYTSFAEHFNGTTWSAGPLSADPTINSVADLSPTNAWAVGDTISHWNGKAWTLIASPVTFNSGFHLRAITALSATDLWAVGYSSPRTGGNTTLAEHFNGTSWTAVSTPSPAGIFTRLNGVSAAGGHVYAVGSTAPDNYTSKTLVLENDQG